MAASLTGFRCECVRPVCVYVLLCLCVCVKGGVACVSAHSLTTACVWGNLLLQAAGVPLRTNNTAYMAYVREYYTGLAAQLKGHYWQEGGPVITAQVE